MMVFLAGAIDGRPVIIKKAGGCRHIPGGNYKEYNGYVGLYKRKNAEAAGKACIPGGKKRESVVGDYYQKSNDHNLKSDDHYLKDN